MEVDESFCHNKNVSQRFPSSSVGQRVSWHWFELSCLEGRERIRLLLNRFAAALWSLNGVVLPPTHTVSCAEWTASSPACWRTLSSFSSHLVHTMGVYCALCANMCTAENTQHAAHTFISQFNPQMYTIQTEYCSIQLNLFQGLMFVMFYTCPLSNSNWTCLPNRSLISHRDLAHFLPTHVFHFMACQRPSYLSCGTYWLK